MHPYDNHLTPALRKEAPLGGAPQQHRVLPRDVKPVFSKLTSWGSLDPYGQDNRPRCKLLASSYFPRTVLSDLGWLPDTGFVEAVFCADASARRKWAVGPTSGTQETLGQHSGCESHPSNRSLGWKQQHDEGFSESVAYSCVFNTLRPFCTIARKSYIAKPRPSVTADIAADIAAVLLPRPVVARLTWTFSPPARPPAHHGHAERSPR